MLFHQSIIDILNHTLLGADELQMIEWAVDATKTVAGSMAEVGVCRGGASYLMAGTDPDRLLYACDSFEGLPAGNPKFDQLQKGQFKADYEEVRNFLNLPNIVVVKGWFPGPAFSALYSEKFSFVHLDLDLYQSTLNALEFFYPRLSRGAILICDDYNWPDCPGVNKAVDEFMFGKPEKLVATDCTCYFVKE